MRPNVLATNCLLELCKASLGIRITDVLKCLKLNHRLYLFFFDAKRLLGFFSLKDCGALDAVFAVDAECLDRETFEHLAESCVRAPGRHWWRCVTVVARATELLPRSQLVVLKAKAMKAMEDGSGWRTALQLGGYGSREQLRESLEEGLS